MARTTLNPPFITDMAQYVEDLRREMMMPYPSVYTALGVARETVTSRATVLEDGLGIVVFKSETTHLTVTVKPGNGIHEIFGLVKGAPVRRQFPYRKGMPGIHRGVSGDLVYFIEDSVPVTKIRYMVVTDDGPQYFGALESMLEKFKVSSYLGPTSPRKEFHGQPRLVGLIGPMHDGRDGDVVTLRYEAQNVYNRNCD